MSAKPKKTSFNKRKMNRLLSLLIKILAGVFGVCLIVFLYLTIFTDFFHPVARLYKVDIPASQELISTSEHIFYFSDSTLVCEDFNGNEIWTNKFSGSELKLAVSESLECVYNSSAVTVLDTSKNILFNVPASNYVFEDAVCGVQSVAVLASLTDGTTSYFIRVFDLAGEEIYRSTYDDSNILGFGLFGDTDNLWSLSLDCSGVSPVSRISTSSPTQNALTGTIDITDQLISDVFCSDATMYLSGTYSLATYDTFGNKESSVQVYGLRCIDSSFSGNNYTMVYIPRADDDISQANTLRILSNTSGEETDAFLTLPSRVTSVYASATHIYCFMKDSVYVYELSGAFFKEVALGFELEHAAKLSDERVVLYSTEGETYYMAVS